VQGDNDVICVRLSPQHCEDAEPLAAAIIHFVWPKILPEAGDPPRLYIEAFGHPLSAVLAHELEDDNICVKPMNERKGTKGVALRLNGCHWRLDGVLLVDASISSTGGENSWRGFALKKENQKWLVTGWEALPMSR
jgi:hypothetical protein